ncbi:MAG: hypothetical protein M9888_06025 [Chitinophagales bacterium]|nr:hypothetical protein [Chitinophagales bacterium]
MGKIEIISFLIQYITILLVSFFYYLKYKKAKNKYSSNQLSLNYEDLMLILKDKFNLEITIVKTNYSTEISYNSNTKKLAIPIKYKNLSQWSLSLIYREIDYLVDTSLKNNKFRNSFNRLIFHYLIALGWIFIGFIFLDDAMFPLVFIYLLPLLLAYFINKRYSDKSIVSFNSFINELNLNIEPPDKETLFNWIYKQPYYLLAVSFSRQIVILKWLFSDKE